MRQFSRTWLGLGCIALLASACGGDDTETTSDTAASAETTVASEADDESTTTTASAETSTTTTTAASAESTSSSSSESEADPEDDSGSVGGVDPATGTGPIDPGLQPLIDDAVGQLTEELDIDPSAITVQSAVLAQWANSSAGCPEKGMEYLQVLTDGAAIELLHGSSTYWFHSGGQRGLFKCTSALRETPPAS